MATDKSSGYGTDPDNDWCCHFAGRKRTLKRSSDSQPRIPSHVALLPSFTAQLKLHWTRPAHVPSFLEFQLPGERSRNLCATFQRTRENITGLQPKVREFHATRETRVICSLAFPVAIGRRSHTAGRRLFCLIVFRSNLPCNANQRILVAGGSTSVLPSRPASIASRRPVRVFSRCAGGCETTHSRSTALWDYLIFGSAQRHDDGQLDARVFPPSLHTFI